MPTPTIRHLHVAIIGSGFGGLGTAIRLKEDGEDDFLIFERASGVGGVWRDNTYPGCACDVPSHLYSFSFARNPDWTREFSPQGEIQAYLEACVDRFGIGPYLRFGHSVEEIAWDEALQHWSLTTSGGRYTADVVVAAVGALSEPGVPSLPGLPGFQGETFHSARWNHDYDLSGKRVAVVGTGASAIQFVPAIQPKVKALTVFQRTAPWVLPRKDRPLSARERRLLRASPALQRLVRSRIYATRELLALAFFSPKVAKLGERIARAHLARAVADPELRERLTPRYTMGCKRILLSNDYYPALTQPNVEVVTDAITRVTATGVVTADGREREVDAIVFGTGFQIQGFPFGKHVRGRDGTLAQAWATTMTAHLGTTVAGFPNLFILQGPNTGLGHTSVVVMIEAQIEHVRNALRFLRRTGASAVEPRREAQEAFVAEVDRDLAGTVWTSGGCGSWYLDAQGRASALWPGFTFTFWRRVAPFRPDEYRTTPAEAGASSGVGRRMDRLRFVGTRAAMGLPSGVYRAMALGKRVRHDGSELDPKLQVMLALDPRAKRSWQESPRALRAEQDAVLMGIRGPLPEVHAVKTLSIPGAAGPLRARYYATRTASAPLLVYFHGGGFVFGNLDTHDVGCRLLCRHGDLNVLSVEYRLVPEHRFPDAIEDARAAFTWAARHAQDLGADPSRVGVAGDSAGANLSAVVSLLARSSPQPPACQVLIYPPTDRTHAHPSLNALADGFLLTRASIEWFHAQYAAAVGADSADPRISPLMARDLKGLAPALVVTAGFDPLRDEGEAYAAALRAAGTPVVLRRFDALVHGFFNLTGVHAPSRAAVLEIAAATRALFETPKPLEQSSHGKAAPPAALRP